MKTLILSLLACSMLLTACVTEPGNAQESDVANASFTVNDLPSNDSIEGIAWQVRAEQPVYLKGSDGAIYLYMNLKSGPAKNQKERVPLNISVVLDRSGSMEGEKMVYAKKAATFLIDQLNNNDILSIVNYDDVIEVSSPSKPVTNKELLKKAIQQLESRSSTNLTGGMLEGYQQVKSTKKSGYVNRVLLMTDGLANVGITEPSEINRLVNVRYLEEGIALSTFGIGADYNEDLLTSIAEAGRGNYYFIGQADKIPDIFAKELKGLLSVIAQNAIYTLDLPEGFTCEKVYGYPFEVKNGKVTVRFNDIYANDEKAILIKLKPGNAVQSNLTLNSQLSYTNAEDFKQQNEKQSIVITVSSDKEKVKVAQDKLVVEMIAMFEATEKMDDILKDVDNRKYEDAKSKGSSMLLKLDEVIRETPSPKLEKQKKELEEYVNNIDSLKNQSETEIKLYQKGVKSSNYEVKKLKR